MFSIIKLFVTVSKILNQYCLPYGFVSIFSKIKSMEIVVVPNENTPPTEEPPRYGVHHDDPNCSDEDPGVLPCR